ncbi:uncharacterized protein BDV17DRAFT_106131 [Aspergillus undulatus]|uniref:uncharacterized protein n=1 Tax=Aspergillus undulatus TaxID=1810928 RepID=UPI003CCD5BDC
MSVDALQSRRSSKSESILKSENSQNQPHSGSAVAPQHPPLQLPSPGLTPRRDSPFYHVSAADAQEDFDQHNDGSQQRSSGSEPISPTQKHHITQETEGEQDRYSERHTPPMEHDRERLSDSREAELWKLFEQFDTLSAKRIRLRQSRMALKFKREAELKLRVNFMRHLSILFANLDQPEAERLRGEYDDLQKATEDYLRMENNYRQEEDEMEEHEYLVSVSMEKFENPLDKRPAPVSQAHTGPSTPSMDDENPIRKLPRCVITYLSRIGDERILQERLAELESEWFFTVERQAQRRHFNMTLDEESEEFLSTFDEQWAKTSQDLNNVQMDVSSLHMLCLDKGYSGFDYEDLSALNTFQYIGEPILQPYMDPLNLPPLKQAVFLNDTESANEGDEDHSGQDWDTPMAPLRRLQSFHLQQSPSMPSKELINKWLLHNLRISPFSIWRLHRSSLWEPLRAQGWQDVDISFFILDAWFDDDAAQAPTPDNPSLDDEPTVVALAGGHGGRERLKSTSLPSSPRAPVRRLGLQRFRSLDFQPLPTSWFPIPTVRSSLAPGHGSFVAI